MKAAVQVLSAFTRDGAGGNPAGVVLDAEGLSEAAMQDLARRVGLPETAFVAPSSRADFRLRFFTPSDEVDLCGHATVAAFSLMRMAGRIPEGEFTQETRVGILGVEVRGDGRVLMEQKLPEFFELVPAEALTRALRVPAAWLDVPGLSPQIVSTGLRDLFVPFAGRKQLLSLKPDVEELKKLSWSLDVIGVHAFTLDPLHEGSFAHSRNFAPLYGIDEEAATGSSTGALACYLRRWGRVPDAAAGALRFEQGDCLGRPSEIDASLQTDGKRITGVWVGGRTTEGVERAFELEVLEPARKKAKV